MEISWFSLSADHPFYILNKTNDRENRKRLSRELAIATWGSDTKRAG